jgi:alpha-glucosidase (family GH31 glycosyl hydrolase)
MLYQGVTAFPGLSETRFYSSSSLKGFPIDWFNPNTQGFWAGEFQRFFNPDTGFDIDGVWLDMNEPSSVSDIP